MYNSPNYSRFNRNEWQQKTTKTATLTKETLKSLTSLNDRISLDDVSQVYMPLIELISIYIQNQQQLQQQTADFLSKENKNVPFIIGIAGSVSVGKSTTARLLQNLLAAKYPDKTVDLMTTDGFLYSNKVLHEKGLMNRKGFPESYDHQKLLQVLLAIKAGQQDIAVPIYSHDIYDVLENRQQVISSPDIVIVEGINVFQLPQSEQIYVSDFFDFSVYVDAQEENIERWFLERFEMHMALAKNDPTNFYYTYATGPYDAAIAMAKDVWRTINSVNLRENILPTRMRADVVLYKGENHEIEAVYLRKY